MDVTTEAETLFGSNPRHRDKAVLLDLTIVNPCVRINLENAVRQGTTSIGPWGYRHRLVFPRAGGFSSMKEHHDRRYAIA